MLKNLRISEKSSTFAPAFEKRLLNGVMVYRFWFCLSGFESWLSNIEETLWVSFLFSYRLKPRFLAHKGHDYCGAIYESWLSNQEG